MAILDVRKSLSISFLGISDRYTTLLFLEIFDKMAAVGITFLAILDQYNFFIFFFYKKAAGGHFGYPKITFDLMSIHFTSIRNLILFINFTFHRICGHFRSIRNFNFFGNF